MPYDLTIAQYTVIAIGIFLGFYIHSIMGFAAALIALPIIAQFMPIQTGIALLSLYVLIFSALFVFGEWRHVDTRVLARLVIGMIPGVTIGTWVLSSLDAVLLKRFLAGFILLFVLHSCCKTKRIEIVEKMGIPLGFLGGFFSLIFSAAGPPFAIYAYNCLDSAKTIRATLICLLFANSLMRVPALATAEILTTKTLYWALAFSPAFVLALILGNCTHHRLSTPTIKKASMTLLTLSALTLLIR